MLALAATPLLAACLPTRSPSAGAPARASAPSGRLVVAQGADPASLDPLQQTGLVEASVYGNVFEALMSLDASGNLGPGLAESYQALNERTWEFKLRDGVRFHNGEPFEATSVRATVEAMLDPAGKSPVRAQLGAIERVETPDPRTARIVTRQPFAPLLAELTGLMMLPPGVLAAGGSAALAQQPIGTGPFRFAEWIHDDHLALEANRDYWGDPPGVGRLEFRPVPESATRMASLQTGGVDLATNVPVDAITPLQRQGLQVITRPGIQTLYLRLNARKPPLDDVRVRQALAAAVDSQRIVDALYGGHARRVNGPFPPEVFGYDPAAPLQAYNPDRARALLREAGQGSGLSLVMETPVGRYPSDREVAQALVGFFQGVGVQVELRTVEWGAYLNRLQAGQGEHLFLLAGTNRTFDPHFTVVRLYANAAPFGKLYYGNGRIDGLADEAAATLDPDRRRALYGQILAILRQDVPAIWLAQLDDLYGLAKDVQWTPRADSLLAMAGARRPN
jgi:peptide/nickel transport system substrate-binding protein